MTKTPIGKEAQKVTTFIEETIEPAVKKIIDQANKVLKDKFNVRVGAEIKWFYEYDKDKKD